MLLKMVIYLQNNKRRWVSTREFQDHFCLGAKQVVRYMACIEAAFPIETDLPARGPGHCRYWKVMS
jgi:hypothetical protein